MKNIIKETKYTVVLALMICMVALNGCSDDFLEPDPVSIYEPGQTFSTESGLRSLLAFCDRHLKLFYTSGDNNAINPIGTEYIFSDLMVPSAHNYETMLHNVAEKFICVSMPVVIRVST